MTEDQLVLLHDKHTLWVTTARHGPHEMRDYHRRMADALGQLLAEHSSCHCRPGSTDDLEARVTVAAEAISNLNIYVQTGFLGGRMAVAAARAALSAGRVT